MRIFIEPNDILMFRDGRPFAGGFDHFARCIFPPSPGTIYGALRSHILSVRWPEFKRFITNPEGIPSEIKREIGSAFEKGTLNIIHLSIAEKLSQGLNLIYPFPRDLVKKKDCKDETLYILSPEDLNTNLLLTDLPQNLSYMWIYEREIVKSISGFITQADMVDYLCGRPFSLSQLKKVNEIFEKEPRTGIRKSRIRRSVEAAGLYSVEYLRLNDKVGFAVEVKGTKLLPEEGIIRLGGDHRSARYYKTLWSDIPVEEIKKIVDRKRRFKLFLTTPAIFSQGWLPSWINKASMEGRWNGLLIRLIGACVDKPRYIGGFDIARGMPKIMKKAVPEGSVYYFEIIKGDINSVFENFWMKSISDERAGEGFGITLIGGW
jgi:CRISPR-associated protein Cmr3